MSKKASVILSYVIMIFEVVSTLVITPLIIRSLGPAEYGVYKLAIAVIAYLLLLDLGIGNAVIRYMSKFRATGDKEQSRKFLGITTIYYFVIAVLAIIGGVILIKIFPTAFAKGLSQTEIAIGQRLLLITMATTAVTLGTSAYANTLIAYECFVFSKICSLVQIILKIFLTILALNLGMRSEGVVYVNLILTVIFRAIYVFAVVFKLKLIPKFRGIDVKFVKEVVLYSSWILLQLIATQLNASVDQVLIGMLVSSSAVIIAVYGIGTQIVQYFQSIGTAFTGVLMPGIVTLVEKKATSEQICDEMVRIGRIMLMSMSVICSAFAIYGRQFITLWVGEGNAAAFYVAFLLMIVYTFEISETVGKHVLYAMNEHKEQSILKFCVVILNIFLTIVLIKWNPLLGATIGTVISLAIGDIVVQNIIYRKKIGISLKKYYKGLLKGILPCNIITIIVGALFKLIGLSGWGGFIVNVAVMCAAYAAVMWILGMNEYEKGIVRSMFNKINLIKRGRGR